MPDTFPTVRDLRTTELLKMADSTREKSPWEETLDSFIRYVALNPKEFLLYGNEHYLIASQFFCVISRLIEGN